MKRYTHKIISLMLFVIGFIVIPSTMAISTNLDSRLQLIDTNLTYAIRPSDVFLYNCSLNGAMESKYRNGTIDPTRSNALDFNFYLVDNITEVNKINNTNAFVRYDEYATEPSASALNLTDATSMTKTNILSSVISEPWSYYDANFTITNNTIRQIYSPVKTVFHMGMPQRYLPNDTTLEDYFTTQTTDCFAMGIVGGDGGNEGSPQSIQEFFQFLTTMVNTTYIDISTFEKSMITPYEGSMNQLIRYSALTNPLNFDDSNITTPAWVNITIGLNLTQKYSTEMILLSSINDFQLNLDITYTNGSVPMYMSFIDTTKMQLFYPTNLTIYSHVGLSNWIWYVIAGIGLIAIGTMWYYRSLCGKPNQDNAMCHIGSKYTNKSKSI